MQPLYQTGMLLSTTFVLQNRVLQNTLLTSQLTLHIFTSTNCLRHSPAEWLVSSWSPASSKNSTRGSTPCYGQKLPEGVNGREQHQGPHLSPFKQHITQIHAMNLSNRSITSNSVPNWSLRPVYLPSHHPSILFRLDSTCIGAKEQNIEKAKDHLASPFNACVICH